MAGHTIQNPEHIIVVGPSKTGTTGLYTAIKQGLANAAIPAKTLFEPPSSDLLDNLFRNVPSTTVMAKVTMDKLDLVVPDIRVFDHRIMIVRDPRDVLVSSLIFRPLTLNSLARADESAVERFIAALEEKEADPSAHSVRGLFSLAAELGIGGRPYRVLSQALDRQRELHEAGLVHVVRYERFVQNDLEDLSKKLGFEVVNQAASDASWIGHITRSRSSGEFPRWFTEDDLTYFNEMYGDHLRVFGYDLEVPLDTEPGIDPATSSEYLRRRYSDRRAEIRQRRVAGVSRQAVAPETMSRLIERAEDGNPNACIRVARILLDADRGSVDLPGALKFARYAAQLGSADGRDMTISLLSRLDPDDPALRRELRTWRMGQPQPPHTLTQHIASSTRRRVRPVRHRLARWVGRRG